MKRMGTWSNGQFVCSIVGMSVSQSEHMADHGISQMLMTDHCFPYYRMVI